MKISPILLLVAMGATGFLSGFAATRLSGSGATAAAAGESASAGAIRNGPRALSEGPAAAAGSAATTEIGPGLRSTDTLETALALPTKTGRSPVSFSIPDHSAKAGGRRRPRRIGSSRLPPMVTAAAPAR